MELQKINEDQVQSKLRPDQEKVREIGREKGRKKARTWNQPFTNIGCSEVLIIGSTLPAGAPDCNGSRGKSRMKISEDPTQESYI